MDALDVAGFLEFDCIAIGDELLESSEAGGQSAAEKWAFTKALVVGKSYRCSEDAPDVGIRVEGEVVHIDVGEGEDEDVDVEGDEPASVIWPSGNIQSLGVCEADRGDTVVGEVPEPEGTKKVCSPKHQQGVTDRGGTCDASLLQTASTRFSCSSCLRNFSSASELAKHVYSVTGQVHGSVQSYTFCREAFSGTTPSGSSDVQVPEVVRKKHEESPKAAIPSDNCGRVPRSEDCTAPLVTGESEAGSAQANSLNGCLPTLSEAETSALPETSDVEQLLLWKCTVGLCGICGKVFKSNSNLKRHALVHDRGILLTCDICGQFFRDRNSLWRHKNLHIGKNQSKIHKCNVCGKQVSSYYALRKHRTQHIQSYVCEVCGESFHRASGLQIHKYLHVR